MSDLKFSTVDVTAPKACNGTVNLFFGENVIQWISDPYLSAAIKKEIERVAAFEAEITTLREATRWIPCSERLPEDESPVFAIRHGRLLLAHAAAVDESSGFTEWCRTPATYTADSATPAQGE